MSFYKPRFKYKNVKVERPGGMSFASKLEAALFDELHLREKAGEIKDLRDQVSVYLTDARIQYIVDFEYYDLREDQTVWAEAKGFETPVWKIKKRLWKCYGPGRLDVYRARSGAPLLTESVYPGVPKCKDKRSP